MENIKYATIIPLIGGMVFGAYKILNKKPEYILSYPPFIKNDSLLTQYWNDVQYYLIDPKTNTLQKNIKLPKVDFVSTLCPCAGLSQLNNGKKRGASAPQNDWMYKTADFVLSTIKPRVLIGENAPGLFSSIGQPVLMNLREIGKKYGYSFSIVKTSTILHGIPQKRPRTFYFFWDTPTVPILEWISSNTPSYEDYLAKYTEKDTEELLVKTNQLQSDPLYIWFSSQHKNWRQWMKTQRGSFMDIMISSGEIEKYLKWVKEKYPNHYRFAERAWKKRLNGQGFWDSSPFLPTGFAGAFTGARMNAVHPIEDRILTRGELMYMMGLPHDMKIVEEKDMGKVFQNVPSVTSAAWQLQVIKFLKGQLKMSDVSFLKQNNLCQRIEKEKITTQLF